MKNGLFEENGELIYYKDNAPCPAGIIRENGNIYYIGADGKALKGQHIVHSETTNGLLERGIYLFGEDGSMIKADTSFSGFIRDEDGRLAYYKDGKPYHAGVVQQGEDIYYIDSHGYAVKGTCDVHTEMSNGILKRGTYTFADDGKLIPGSYISPQRSRSHSAHKKMRMVKDIWIAAAGVLVIIGVLISVRYLESRQTAKKQMVPGGEDHSVSSVINLPVFDEEVLLCSDAAKTVFDGKATVPDAPSGKAPYKPFVFEYKIAGTDGTLFISDSPDMQNAKEYPLTVGKISLSVENLKTGTTYFYKVVVGDETTKGYFTTARSTRFINMPGVTNTRDIGGYITLDGKTIKQGMIIRGAEIDGLVDVGSFLSDDAVKSAEEVFGFVYDFDLRAPSLVNGSYQSRLGENVAHKFYNAPATGAVFTAAGQSALADIFADLADPANYPMYLHCTNGADKTGTICFLLEGILNLPEDVMEADYQLSGYYYPNFNYQSFNAVYGGIEGYEGDTVGQKIVSYLTSPEVGVTPEQIESIRGILLED